MYLILKKAGVSADNLWSFYAENGVLWTGTTEQDAVDKIEQLAATTALSELRLVKQIDILMEVTAVPEEGPDPPEEP